MFEMHVNIDNLNGDSQYKKAYFRMALLGRVMSILYIKNELSMMICFIQ